MKSLVLKDLKEIIKQAEEKGLQENSNIIIRNDSMELYYVKDTDIVFEIPLKNDVIPGEFIICVD